MNRTRESLLNGHRLTYCSPGKVVIEVLEMVEADLS